MLEQKRLQTLVWRVSQLNKNIELHIFKNRKEIQMVKTGLIKNVINGYVVKGQIQDFVKVT